MKKFDSKSVLVNLYLLSRFIIKNSKRMPREIVLRSIIITLLDEKPRTVRELSKIYSTNHSFMSAVVAMLEKEGLVKKKRFKDQRYRVVSLTPKGREMLKEIYKIRCEYCTGFFSKMTDEEVKKLGDLILKLDLDYRHEHFK